MRQVVQPADQPRQVTTAVAVRIAEQVHLHAIDDRLPVPTIRHAPTSPLPGTLPFALNTSPLRPAGRGERQSRFDAGGHGGVVAGRSSLRGNKPPDVPARCPDTPSTSRTTVQSDTPAGSA